MSCVICRSTIVGCGLWPTTLRSQLSLPLAVTTALSSCGAQDSQAPFSHSLPEPTSAQSSSTLTTATCWPMAQLTMESTMWTCVSLASLCWSYWATRRQCHTSTSWALMNWFQRKFPTYVSNFFLFYSVLSETPFIYCWHSILLCSILFHVTF